MIGPPNVVDPRPAGQEELQQAIRAQYQIVEVLKDRDGATLQIENVRFQHDPEWRDRFWSLEAAKEGRKGWWIVGLLFYVAQLSWAYIFGEGLRFR